MSKLLLRADDLGFSEAVNLGILKSVRGGMIRNVGMMSNMESAKSGYHLLKNQDIALGLHVNLCAGRCVSDPKEIPTIAKENGVFFSSADIRSREKDTIGMEEAEIEIDAQVQKFREITNKNPDYMDVHAIQSPHAMEAAAHVADKYQIFYDRVMENKQWEKDHHLYGLMAKPDETNTYDAVKFFEDHKQFMKEHNTVVVFHPGYLDYYILTHSSYTVIRPFETEFLTSEYLKAFVATNQLELSDFRKL